MSADFGESSADMRALHELRETAVRWGDGPQLDICERHGDPAEEIIYLAREMNVDMIVIASHGRGTFDRLRLGSVADRVVRSASTPVMVVRQSEAALDQSVAEVDRLVLLTDGSPYAQAAEPAAEQLARQLGLPILVLRVTDHSRLIAGAALGVPVPPDLYTHLDKELLVEAQTFVDGVAKSFVDKGLTAEGMAVIGPVAHSILSLLTPRDLVVMTSHGRSGITRWVLGSVAEKLVQLAPSPVVIVPVAKRYLD
jgi:nucleotide-binding universal stress UspA family protein